jgi:hypothetical protein
MALPTPYHYLVKHAPGLYARVLLNDVPLYRRTVDVHLTPSGPCRHLVVPGENSVRIELGAYGSTTPPPGATFEFQVLRGPEEAVCFAERWPDYTSRYPEDERRLPMAHTRSFHCDDAGPIPVWRDAPRGGHTAHDKAEQVRLVQEVRQAFVRKDVDAFLGAYSLKLEEHRAFYGAVPELAPAVARERYAGLLALPWVVEPIEPEQLSLQSHADGRVALVTRMDGTAVLSARLPDDPTQEWEADLLLTRNEGRWRIYW